MRSIFELPSTIVAALLNLESDWIRYGLPAVVLTVIFFFAMRFEGRNIDSSLVPSAETTRVVVPVGPKQSTVLSAAEDGRSEIPARSPGHEALAPPLRSALRPAQPYVPLPRSAIFSNSQTEGRRALCGAVQYVMTRVGKKHWKSLALQFAVEDCRMPSGGQTAQQAVDNALVEYKTGTWDESQCPSIPGRPALAKGAIAQVMR